MGILCNLYPPILNSSSPAFVRNSSCKVHFSLSYRNSIDDIIGAQVVVNSQKTNQSGLSLEKYPNGIKIFSRDEIEFDNDWDGDDKYYIKIHPSDMENGEFPLNEFFKVQIRLTGKGAESTESYNSVWLINNVDYFSEWSRVCLIKGINKPVIEFFGLEKEIDNDEKISYLKSPTLELKGEFKYDDASNTVEMEYLNKYQITIYKKNDLTKSLIDSGVQYTETSYGLNQINYIVKYLFIPGTTYTMKFWFSTNNLYEDTYTYNFSIADNAIVKLDSTDKISATANIEDACIDVIYSIKKFVGNLIIRRTSSKSNFQEWHDVYTVAYTPAQTVENMLWKDFTIESGVFYLYGLQKRNSSGSRGPMVVSSEAEILELEFPCLTSYKKNLKLAYDFKISNFSYKVAESVTETLGSKYPFVRRNGDLKYRTFSISGLISSIMDDSKEYSFTSKNEIYGNIKESYKVYNENNNINDNYDYIYERNFREKVMDFLYDDKPKLFRSMTEGNILIKLTNITFTPNEVLGRMLYSFSATANEIDEPTEENNQLYNIQPMQDFVSYVASSEDKISLKELDIQPDEDVISTIANSYENNDESSVFDKDNFYMKNIIIYFNSDPYQIVEKDGKMTVATNSNSDSEDNIFIGYIMTLNGEDIYVNRNGIYSINNDVPVKTLSFPVYTDITVSGNSVVTFKENTTLDYYSFSYNKISGQLNNYYFQEADNEEEYQNISNDVFEEIKEKYNSKADTYITYLDSLDTIQIETEQNVIFKVIEDGNTKFFSSGSTGYINLTVDGITSLKLYKSPNNIGADVNINYVGEVIKEVL